LSQGYAPLAIRFFILSSHYRQTTDFSDEALKGAAKGYERLVNTVALVRQTLAKATGEGADAANPEILQMIEQHRQRFLEAMDNDFNTPQALATLFDFNKQVNTLLNSGEPLAKATLAAIDDTYRRLGGDILGLIPGDIQGAHRLSGSEGAASAGLEEDLIRLLVDLRAAARKNKDFATSDAIRDQLAAMGVVLEDRAEGTVWKVNLH